MKVLVTGAAGFIGKNLVSALENIRKGLDRTRNLTIDAVFSFCQPDSLDQLQKYCNEADFVFHLAGVNRPKDTREFQKGNEDLTKILTECLKKSGRTIPLMLASSQQAFLTGRFAGSLYGVSKAAAETVVFDYAKSTGASVYIYRFPNVFGKWARPDYNSAVATFCHHMARNLPIHVTDSSVELELLYIDDLVCEMLDVLEGKAHRCRFVQEQPQGDAEGPFCYVPVTYKASLGAIVHLIERFKEQPRTLVMPEIPKGSFAQKLFSTYLSYLPEEGVRCPLGKKEDRRGSFTEIIKTSGCGQISVNISKPGCVKGQHWHQSKWELFVVLSGRALIQERRIGVDTNGNAYPVLNFEVSGDSPEMVYMLPGYTHNIINLSDTQNLVTLMWANENFDVEHPDTYFEPVE